ncbi:hypothetical protein C8R43DRAFT_946838 [Mycena crocata]|nr:hypothetical protein C8R43DRAFT_946838 [Mycena crocata]
MVSPSLNDEPCGSVDDDGCLQIFPHFEGPPGTLCMKCKKIKTAATEEQCSAIQKDFKSCEGCGLCSTQLTEALCGKCKRKGRPSISSISSLFIVYSEAEENGVPNPKDIGAAERAEKLRKRTRIPAPSPLTQITNLSSVGPMTQASELDALRTAKSSNGVLELAVTHADIAWIKDHNHPLSLNLDDCTLRFKNNILFEERVQSMTLKGLYTFYCNRPDRIQVAPPAKLGVAKGAGITLECVIDVARYKDCLERLKVQVGDDSLLSSSKCKNTNSEVVLVVDKRAKTGNGTLYSSVRLTNNFSALGYNAQPAATPAASITFIKFDGRLSDERAELCHIPGEFTRKMECTTLILSMSDQGKSKNLYIEGDDQVYVAKRYFDVGGEHIPTTHVSKAENDLALANDLFRLKHLAMYRERFMELVAVKNFSEVIEHRFSRLRSILDLITESSAAEDDESAVTYLVEPLRSTSVVRKFSGTLGATQDTDKLALTMLAFSHFIMEFRVCAMSMVDLQGSFHANFGAVRILTLFDPMSHTATK